MLKKPDGNALVEFALTLPILISLFIPALQLIHLALVQARLESLALQVARRLAAEAPAGADLTAAAETLTAGLRPAVSCRADLRRLTTIAVAFPRRPRSVDVVDVTLRGDGPRILGRDILLSAHAREFRWGLP